MAGQDGVFSMVMVKHHLMDLLMGLHMNLLFYVLVAMNGGATFGQAQLYLGQDLVLNVIMLREMKMLTMGLL